MLDLSDLPAAVRSEGGVSRRLFLAYGAALSALPQLAERTPAADRGEKFAADPFQLGVASGDPDATSVVLWTRLAPRPLDPDGGMPPEAVAVRWEVAEDDALRKVVASGSATAAPGLAHSVHVEVPGLKPDRWYWYRFRAGDATSPVARTRTLPASDAAPDRLRFAFASCHHYEHGLYTAYERMAKDDLDLVFFLGDYIYESPGAATRVRKHNGPAVKLKTLADYRGRHSLYRSDPLLQAVHARCPWFVTWDDHEVENNYADAVSERPGVDPADFLAQRAAAYQAYYEAMPLRPRSLPKGPNLQLYRKASFGRLAEFLILDTRQYRSDQPAVGKIGLNATALSPQRSILGADQRAWLQASLAASPATWNVLAQQVMMGMVAWPGADGGPTYTMDQWPGYAHERMTLVEFLAARKVANPVVLTGDIHSNWVNDLRIDDRKAETPVVATEFVGTSVTSGGNGVNRPRGHDGLVAANPGVRFHNGERGYVRCTVTPGTWASDFVVVDNVTKPGGTTLTRASYVIEAGTPGAKRA